MQEHERRKRRRGGGGLGGDAQEQTEAESLERPEVTDEVALIDQALAQAQEAERRRGCGCL